MAIHISASSISDYLDCSKKLDYRVNRKIEQEPTMDMLVGTFVHDTLERNWRDRELALQELKKNMAPFSFSRAQENKAEACVHNFFDNFASMMGEEDKIEYKFRIPLHSDVFLVGKIDRISSGNIFDYKTGSRIKTTLASDVQMIIYKEAYRRLFGEDPHGVFLIGLQANKFAQFIENPRVTDLLFSTVIPEMLRAIRGNHYIKSGVFTGACYTCPFSSNCLEDIYNGMASRKSTQE